jgi:hypothetical protein
VVRFEIMFVSGLAMDSIYRSMFEISISPGCCELFDPVALDQAQGRPKHYSWLAIGLARIVPLTGRFCVPRAIS